jgi:hypothetical protein
MKFCSDVKRFGGDFTKKWGLEVPRAWRGRGWWIVRGDAVEGGRGLVPS